MLDDDAPARKIGARLDDGLKPGLSFMCHLARAVAGGRSTAAATKFKSKLENQIKDCVMRNAILFTYRDTFANQVREHGVAGLIKSLAAKNHSNDMLAKRDGASANAK